MTASQSMGGSGGNHAAHHLGGYGGNQAGQNAGGYGGNPAGYNIGGGGGYSGNQAGPNAPGVPPPSYAEGGYPPAGHGGNFPGNYPTSGTMSYTTGTYAGVNVMYTASGPVGYSGNVAIMYSTSPPQAPPPQGGLVSPGGSMRGRLPLLLSKQLDGEEPTYVTVKAKK